MTTDVTLFQAQRKIYPQSVKGHYRKLKWLALSILLGIYYAVPWIRWDRGPHAPDQAILIDMPGRRGYFFFIEIWPQEVFYITGILIFAAISLFFVTSLFGRIWCGYACPQTVWTDLFIKVEEFFQGDRNSRLRRDRAPWNINTGIRKVSTHIVWILIGLVTGGAWVFYFNDAPTLADQILHGDVPRTVALWVAGLTFSTYLMAGYAREQVCTYMCPYSRFQSAMFDQDTLIISYDQERGEPRGSHKQGESWEGRGHCIDCHQCVTVCPMGIDIRKGLQMECIACGLCVDSCNTIMDKIGLPNGLIRYDTERNKSRRKDSPDSYKLKGDRYRFFRARSILYSVVLCLVGVLMITSLAVRSSFDLHILHDRNPLFVQLTSGATRNSYTVKIINKSLQDHTFALSMKGLEGALLSIEGAGTPDPENLTVLADSVGQYRVLVTLQKRASHQSREPIEFTLTDRTQNHSQIVNSIFIDGP